jgi:hypothetical protein
MKRWDETWHRLREWTNGQGQSERLAAQILINEGFRALDPSHPLGGRDGGRDATCTKDGYTWIMAVYFPRGQKEWITIREKFLRDLEGAKSSGGVAIAFVTNQELRLAERRELAELATPLLVELYHLEKLTAILDSPAMSAVRKQFLDFDLDDEPTLILGGQGGMAPGAGGGGGAAIGTNARGGDGGKGGRTSLRGQDGQTPGAGGGGGGAMGEHAQGGEGGEGGEIVSAWLRGEDLPPTVKITPGRGGKGGEFGGDGAQGEDSAFGDLLRAKGGRGGRAGHVGVRRPANVEDISAGLQVCSIYLAECVHMKQGLLYLLGAGWEHYQVPHLPFELQWPLICSVSLGRFEERVSLEMTFVVTAPTGIVASRQAELLYTGEPRSVRRPNVMTALKFTAAEEGIWRISILSGEIPLAEMPIEIVCGSA